MKIKLLSSILTMTSGSYIYYKYNINNNKFNIRSTFDINNFSYIQLIKMHTDKLEINIRDCINIEKEKIIPDSVRLKDRFFLVFNIKQASKELSSICKILRNYLNDSNKMILSKEFKTDFELDQIIDKIKMIILIKENFIERKSFATSIFDRFDDITMRLFSDMVILNKKNNYKLISKLNLDYIINYCDEIINNEDLDKINDNKILNAKRILINNFSSKDYFYSDYLLEVNLNNNFKDMIINKKVNEDNFFDYDLIFLHGLNVLNYKLG